MEEPNSGAASPARLALYMTSWCRFCASVVSAADRLGSEIVLRDIDVNSDWREELVVGTGRETVPCLRIEAPSGAVTWMHESRDIIRQLEEVSASGPD